MTFFAAFCVSFSSRYTSSGFAVHLHDAGAQLIAAVLVDGKDRRLRAELQKLDRIAHADGAGRLPGVAFSSRWGCILLPASLRLRRSLRLLFVGAGDERAVFRLLAQLLQLFIDRVGRAAGVVDDILRFLCAPAGLPFPFPA